MGHFDRQIATAKKLIAKNGELVTWRQLTNGTPDDASKPWKPSAGSAVDFPNVSICFLPNKRIGNPSTKPVKDAPEVNTGTYYGLMFGGVPFEPKKKDQVIRSDGTLLRIADFDKLSPNGQQILYTIFFDE